MMKSYSWAIRGNGRTILYLGCLKFHKRMLSQTAGIQVEVAADRAHSRGIPDTEFLLSGALSMRLQVHGAAKAALSAATAIARAGLAAGSPEPTELARKRPSMQLLPKLLELACCLRAAACLSIARSTAYDPTAAYFKVACGLMLLRSKMDDKKCAVTSLGPLLSPLCRLMLLPAEPQTQNTLFGYSVCAGDGLLLLLLTCMSCTL